MGPQRLQPSSPFLSRELNGEVLLDELDELRRGQVPQQQLDDCARALRCLEGPVSSCAALVRQLAKDRYAEHLALASLLKRWATRLKTDADAPLLAAHFERLALSSALISALHRASDQLRGRR